MPADAQTTGYAIPAEATLLSVSAQGEARQAPDMATLSTGVVTQAADANAAMKANSTQMAKVMSAIKAAGIADKDVQTSGINLNPQYRYQENKAPTITGYEASNTVSIKVRDIDKVGKVLDALVASGSNQINGPTFGIDQPEGLYDQARKEALGKARARADMYAKSLGMTVRRIVSINEGGGGGYQPPRPMMMMKAMASDAGAAPPVAAGENSVSANLEVVFELGS